MRIRIDSFSQIKKEILATERKIIIYGAGMIGTITTMSILEEHQLQSRADFFLDGDVEKQGELIQNLPVYAKEKLKAVNAREYVLFIAISRFYELFKELNEYENLKEMDCYIVPILCIENYKPLAEDIIRRKSKEPEIPKIINYMWLGKKEIPASLQKCIDSWKKYCPDYELRLWNEDNYDIEKIPYMKQAYEKKAYGFVPDYARLDILYHYGGLYLDTDVELIRNIDDLLYQKAFCSVEKWQTINFGGGSGAMPQNTMIGNLLKEREEILFCEPDGRINKNTCGYFDTKIFMKYGYKINGKIQSIEDMTVYPYEVFHPYDYMSGKIQKTVNTCGIHHFNGGWLDETMTKANEITKRNYENVIAMADSQSFYG